MKDIKLVLKLFYEDEEPRLVVLNGIIELVVYLNTIQDCYDDKPKAITIEQIGSVDTYDEGYEIGIEEGKEENQDRINELESALEDAKDWLDSVKRQLKTVENDLNTAFDSLVI